MRHDSNVTRFNTWRYPEALRRKFGGAKKGESLPAFSFTGIFPQHASSTL